MPPVLTNIFFLLLAYLAGSLSSAIILCKLYGLPDPRQAGSGNPGTTNMLRVNGRKLAIYVLLGDLLKGLLPVLLAKHFVSSDFLGWITLSAVIGHIYPVFFQFKGGKGVATSAGALLGFSFMLGLGVIFIWLIIAVIFRYSSLAALAAAVSAPVYGYFLMRTDNTVMLSLLCLLILYKHYANIRKLLSGSEPKIGQ